MNEDYEQARKALRGVMDSGVEAFASLEKLEAKRKSLRDFLKVPHTGTQRKQINNLRNKLLSAVKRTVDKLDIVIKLRERIVKLEARIKEDIAQE